MQEDLLILKDLIFEGNKKMHHINNTDFKKYLPFIIFYVEYPEIESGSKEFAQKLLQAFQLRHPSCLETARSLLVSIEVGINIT